MPRTHAQAGAAKAQPANARPARRGRPTAERAAAIEEVIRASALDLFLDIGFEATTMDAIAVAAGVSKGTLYARYPNKDVLFLSVLQGQRERLSRQAEAFNHLLPDDLEGRLRHHARTLLRAAQNPEYKRTVNLVDSNASTFPELAQRWHEVGTQGYLQLLATNMAAAASPAQKSIDWDFVANLFLHAVSGWLRTQSSLRVLNEAQATAFSDQVVAVVMAWVAVQGHPTSISPVPE